MASITISTISFGIPYQGTATSLELRIFAGGSFITADSELIPASPLVYKTATCPIAGGIVTIPAVTLDSTTDSLTNPNVRYTLAALYEPDKSTPVAVVLDNFEISHVYTTTTWTTLMNQRTGGTRRRIEGVYTIQQTDAAIASYGYSKAEIDARELDDLADVRTTGVEIGDVLEWDGTNWVAGAGNASLGSYALELTTARSHNINHGIIFVPGVDYTQVFFEAWVKPTSTGYIHSGGYGGTHPLLFGFNGSSAGYTLTGNIFDTNASTSVSFASTATVRHNEWCHVAVAYDGTRVTLMNNGKPVSVTAFTDSIRIDSAFDAVSYIGGSDHLNMSGRIAGWRMFINKLPYTSPHQTVVRPALINFNRKWENDGTTMQDATVCADYRQRQLTDLSGNGYNGFLCEATAQGNTLTGDGGFYDMPIGIGRTPANEPTWVIDPISYTGSATPATPISGAVIFDSFGRADIHKGNQTALTWNLGTTEVGSRTWSGSTKYGIWNGLVSPRDTTPGVAFVTDTQVNREIRLAKPNTAFVTGYGLNYAVVFNYTDASNYNYVAVDEYGQGFVYERVSGTDTQNGATMSFGTGWTVLKVIITTTTIAGDTVEVFKDTASIASRTLTQNLSATSKGFSLNHPLQEIDYFAVI